LVKLQVRALEEGLPHQTFISSILHKFVTGRLVDVAASSLAASLSSEVARACRGWSYQEQVAHRHTWTGR